MSNSKKTQARVDEIVTELLDLFDMEPAEVAAIHLNAVPQRVTFDRLVKTVEGQSYRVQTLADGTQV